MIRSESMPPHQCRVNSQHDWGGEELGFSGGPAVVARFSNNSTEFRGQGKFQW